MANTSFDNSQCTSRAWIALRRLDENDDRVVALKKVPIPRGTDASVTKQIVSKTFGLNCADVTYKLKNHHGSLIPLNGSIPVNCKHMPHVLDVAKVFQHVLPKPRTVPMTVMNNSMKTRLQSVGRRIERLEELLPQIKLRHHDKLNQEIGLLNQKLSFLHKRMQMADSHVWRGTLTRSPLW